jgi:hypothetical protein
MLPLFVPLADGGGLALIQRRRQLHIVCSLPPRFVAASAIGARPTSRRILTIGPSSWLSPLSREPPSQVSADPEIPGQVHIEDQAKLVLDEIVNNLSMLIVPYCIELSMSRV